MWRPPKDVKILQGCKSEPALPEVRTGLGRDGSRSEKSAVVEDVLYWRRTCIDLFSALENQVPRSPNVCPEVIGIKNSNYQYFFC